MIGRELLGSLRLLVKLDVTDVSSIFYSDSVQDFYYSCGWFNVDSFSRPLSHCS